MEPITQNSPTTPADSTPPSSAIFPLPKIPKSKLKSRFRLTSSDPGLRTIPKKVNLASPFGSSKHQNDEAGSNGTVKKGNRSEGKQRKTNDKQPFSEVRKRLDRGPRDDCLSLLCLNSPETSQELEEQSSRMQEDFARLGSTDGKMIMWLPNGQESFIGGTSPTGRAVPENNNKQQLQRAIDLENIRRKQKAAAVQTLMTPGKAECLKKANDKWDEIITRQRNCPCKGLVRTGERATPKYPPGLGFPEEESSRVPEMMSGGLQEYDEADHRERHTTHLEPMSSSTSESYSTTPTSIRTTPRSSLSAMAVPHNALEWYEPAAYEFGSSIADQEDVEFVGMDFSEEERRIIGFYNDERSVFLEGYSESSEDDFSSSRPNPSFQHYYSPQVIEERKLFGSRYWDEKCKIWRDYKERTGKRNTDMGDTIGFLGRSVSRAGCTSGRSINAPSAVAELHARPIERL